MIIEWDDAWNIGHAEIDEQHKQWVGFYNNLDEAFRSEDAQDLSKAQGRILNEMVDYTIYHFTTEEDLMRETKFPDAPNLWRLHKNFKSILFEQSRNRLEDFNLLCPLCKKF